MLHRAQICHSISSICPSVFHDQVPWSHRLEYFENNFTATLIPTPAIWSNRNTPKIGWNRVGVSQEHKKPAISPKWCKTGPRLLWRTNRKLHTRFQLVSKSMTLDDLKWPKCTLVEKNCFTEPTRKIWKEIDPYYQWKNVGQWFYFLGI